jgi:hypothetical protein
MFTEQEMADEALERVQRSIRKFKDNLVTITEIAVEDPTAINELLPSLRSIIYCVQLLAVFCAGKGQNIANGQARRSAGCSRANACRQHRVRIACEFHGHGQS